MTDLAHPKAAIPTFMWLALVVLFFNSATATFAAGEASVSEPEAVNALLQDLDGQFERLEKLQQNLPTKAERAAEEMLLATLKERRIDLRKKFNQDRYEALKTDVAVESARLTRELAKTTSTPPTATSDPADQTGSVILPAKIESVRAASGEKINNPQIQAMLASLQTEITELEKKVNKMPVSSERDAAKRRAQVLHDRSVDLTNAFDKGRYDVLRNDVKSEWNTVTR